MNTHLMGSPDRCRAGCTVPSNGAGLAVVEVNVTAAPEVADCSNCLSMRLCVNPEAHILVKKGMYSLLVM